MKSARVTKKLRTTSKKEKPASLPTLPIIRPAMGKAEVAAVRRVIFSGWLTQGPEVAAFEKEFAEFVGAGRACAVSNCTVALHLALKAAGVGPGDEVITVSHTFIATANAIRYCGATPIFVDIDPKTFNLDPNLVERRITPKTKAIVAVHQLGMPCDLEALCEITKRRNLFLIEDAACAIGSEILWDGKWERIGKSHGDAVCFSFHPRKLLTTGDGGMITTRHAEWDKKFRLWRQHGMSASDVARHSANEIVFESYLEVGYNYRLTDVQAAIGREQLKSLSEVIRLRRQIVEKYRELLKDIKGLRFPAEPPYAKTNWQSFCVGLPNGTDQKAVMQKLLDAGIATRRGVMCVHREPAYLDQAWGCGTGPGACGCPKQSCARLLRSEHAQDSSIILPLFHSMTAKDIARVATALTTALKS